MQKERASKIYHNGSNKVRKMLSI